MVHNSYNVGHEYILGQLLYFLYISSPPPFAMVLGVGRHKKAPRGELEVRNNITSVFSLLDFAWHQGLLTCIIAALTYSPICPARQIHFPVNLLQDLADFEQEQFRVQFTPHVFKGQGLSHTVPVHPSTQLQDPVPESHDAPFLH